ncbi:MAG: ribbon-helix-helix domain-containing protein [Planctomycetota bacterium]
MDDERKSFPLRLSKELFDQLKAWADQEMRSVNGQIEYLLREAVKRRSGKDGDKGGNEESAKKGR